RGAGERSQGRPRRPGQGGETDEGPLTRRRPDGVTRRTLAAERDERPMRLDDILQGDDAFVFMERYVDEAAKTYSPFAGQSEVAPEYRPRSDRPSFELVTVLAPEDRISVFQADPTEALRRHYVRPEGVLFAVHPETWSSPDIDGADELRALPRGES